MNYLFLYNLVLEVPKTMYTMAFKLVMEIGGKSATVPGSLTYTQPFGEKRSVSGMGMLDYNFSGEFSIKV